LQGGRLNLQREKNSLGFAYVNLRLTEVDAGLE